MGIGDWLRSLFDLRGTDPAPRLPPEAPARDEIEARLRRSNVPGAALARIIDGEVAWVAGYGTARARRRAAHVTGDTVFQAASVSKPVTALAVMQLVDAGRLDLDADVRDLAALPIPEHPILDHHPDRSRRPITVRLLLQHRGGIVGRGTTPSDHRTFLDESRGGGSLRYRRVRGVRLPTMEESWLGSGGRLGVTVTYPPGTRASYSGTGYLVLQHVVEQVTGSSFADHMAATLMSFGARAATFELEPPSHLPLARGHDVDGRELPGGFELVPWSAAGGLFTSAASLAEVVATIVRGDDAVLAADTIDLMARQRLGFSVRRRPGQTVLLHGGDNGGYRASITGVLETRSGAVVLTNGRSQDGPDLRRELADLVLPLG